jgi:ubiquitin carboxyl-terminal hydrolase L5
VFLFKWTADEEPAGSLVQDSRLDKIFFAKQVINNACATQAILSVLMNIDDPAVVLGSTLQVLNLIFFYTATLFYIR